MRMTGRNNGFTQKLMRLVEIGRDGVESLDCSHCSEQSRTARTRLFPLSLVTTGCEEQWKQSKAVAWFWGLQRSSAAIGVIGWVDVRELNFKFESEMGR